METNLTIIQADQTPVPATLTKKQWDDVALVVDAFIEGAHFKEWMNPIAFVEQDDLDLDGITHAINAQVMEAV